MKRKTWPVVLVATLGIAVLMSLGVWQVERLAWKNALITDIDRGLQADPVGTEVIKARLASGQSVDFMKVKVNGHFMSSDYLLPLTTLDGGPAWYVLRPFTVEDGSFLMVNCGKSTSTIVGPPLSDNAELIGVLTPHRGKQGYFDPDNDAANNRWYWWDVSAMLETLLPGLRAPEGSLEFRLLPGSPGTEGLVVDPPKAALRNNHLGYAITWFGLAAVLAVMAGIFVWRLRQDL